MLLDFRDWKQRRPEIGRNRRALVGRVTVIQAVVR